MFDLTLTEEWMKGKLLFHWHQLYKRVVKKVDEGALIIQLKNNATSYRKKK